MQFLGGLRPNMGANGVCACGRRSRARLRGVVCEGAWGRAGRGGCNARSRVIARRWAAWRCWGGTREESRLPVTQVGGGWRSAAICVTSYWPRRWLALTKWALDKGGATEVATSWLIMMRATAQAGNRASKTARRPQWWESEPEWGVVTSGVALAARLTAILRVRR